MRFSRFARWGRCCLVFLLLLSYAVGWHRGVVPSDALFRGASKWACASRAAPLHAGFGWNEALDISKLSVDFKTPLGTGSYGKVFAGTFNNQPVVVKEGSDTKEGLQYLESEAYFNRKLTKAMATTPTANQLFAPYLGFVQDKSGSRWLLWKRTGKVGLTLKTLLERGDLIPTLIGLGMGTDRTSVLHNLLGVLAKMVEFVHDQGIVHRDIKPANIVIDDEAKTLRLIDFGSAADMKGIFRNGYNANKSPCSPFYCAPEEFLDESHPWAFDVYSLGVVWLRCVFPHLHSEPAWEEFYHELKLSEHDIDVWLQRKLGDDVMPAGMLEGLEFFTDDAGRGWRLLKAMLKRKPSERLALDFLLSDPYITGAGGMVSRKSELSRTYFDAVVEETVDICLVEEEPLSYRITLSRPFGLGLAEMEGGAGVIIDALVVGGAAERTGLIAVGDMLLSIGDISCVGLPFDEVMGLIRDFPLKKVPLMLERGSAHLAATAALPRALAQVKATECGVVSVKGKREKQEDMFSLRSLSVMPLGEEEPVRAHLAAVYDGHRGVEASKFATVEFPALVRKSLARRHRTSDTAALRVAWEALSSLYLRTGHQSGSTAAIALLCEGALTVLNCGDSRVVLVSQGVDSKGNPSGVVAFATEDHGAGVPEEMKRITDAGGEVSCKLGRARVHAADWTLALSRSLGGSEWRSACIIPQPDVTTLRLTDVNTAVIVASDGLWCVIDNDRAAALVEGWRIQGKTATESAQLLIDTALEQGSPDNCTVIVMYLAV